jgi:SAM-dependent methyltransferase
LSSEPAIGRTVLDIGCGHSVNPTLEKIAHRLGQLDGVDPFPAIVPPLHLANRWTCRLEDIPVGPDTYDMAYSYNVVEHVEDRHSFLMKVIEILKPGGVYWSMSPNARHPFTWITRVAQIFRIKNLYRNSINKDANDYPAYYRLSHDAKILLSIKKMKLSVSRVDFYYISNVQWDMYFPARLRAIPHVLDRLLLLRRSKLGFIFMFRIQKA